MPIKGTIKVKPRKLFRDGYSSIHAATLAIILSIGSWLIGAVNPVFSQAFTININITSNRLDNSGVASKQYGISIKGGSNYNAAISSNTIRNFGLSGVRLENFSSPNSLSIKSNIITTCGTQSYTYPYGAAMGNGTVCSSRSGCSAASGIQFLNSLLSTSRITGNIIRHNTFSGIALDNTRGYIGPNNAIKYNGQAVGNECQGLSGPGSGDGGVTVRNMQPADTLIVSENLIENNYVNTIARKDCIGTVRYNGAPWAKCGYWGGNSAGIYITEDNYVLSNTTVSYPDKAWGVVIVGGVKGVRIKNCVIKNNMLVSNSLGNDNGIRYPFGGGILVGPGVEAYITGNRIYSNGFQVQPAGRGGNAGIVLRCADSGTRITSNYIYSNASDGIDIRGGSGTVIGAAGGRNSIYRNGRSGIALEESEGNVTITSNSITYNYDTGVQARLLNTGLNSFIIRNNQINSNRFAGVALNSVQAYVGPNNTIRYNGTFDPDAACVGLRGPGGKDGGVAVTGLNSTDTVVVSGNVMADNFVDTISRSDCIGTVRYNGVRWNKCGYWDALDAKILVDATWVYRNGAPLDPGQNTQVYSGSVIVIDGNYPAIGKTISGGSVWGVAVLNRGAKEVRVRNCIIENNNSTLNSYGPNKINLGGGILVGPGARASIYNNVIRSNGLLTNGDADNTIDGDTNTQWQTNEYDDTAPHFISIKLGAASYAVTGIKLYIGNTAIPTRRWDAYITNTANWGIETPPLQEFAISSVMGGAGKTGWQTLTFPSKTGAYVRLQTSNPRMVRNELYELQYQTGGTWYGYGTAPAGFGIDGVLSACSELKGGSAGIILRCNNAATVITSNRISSNKNMSIDVRDGAGTIGPRNLIRKNPNNYAIGVIGNCSSDTAPLTFYNNWITSSKYGIGIYDVTGNVVIDSNYIYSNNPRGLSISRNSGTLKATVKRNKVYNNLRAFNFEGSYAENQLILSVYDNKIYTNSVLGIRLRDLNNDTIVFRNNRITNNKQNNNSDGIQGEYSGGTDLWIYSNYISQNGNLNNAYNTGTDSGLRFKSFSTVRIEKTMIVSNYGPGIRMDGGEYKIGYNYDPASQGKFACNDKSHLQTDCKNDYTCSRVWFTGSAWSEADLNATGKATILRHNWLSGIELDGNDVVCSISMQGTIDKDNSLPSNGNPYGGNIIARGPLAKVNVKASVIGGTQQDTQGRYGGTLVEIGYSTGYPQQAGGILTFDNVNFINGSTEVRAKGTNTRLQFKNGCRIDPAIFVTEGAYTYIFSHNYLARINRYDRCCAGPPDCATELSYNWLDKDNYLLEDMHIDNGYFWIGNHNYIRGMIRGHESSSLRIWDGNIIAGVQGCNGHSSEFKNDIYVVGYKDPNYDPNNPGSYSRAVPSPNIFYTIDGPLGWRDAETCVIDGNIFSAMSSNGNALIGDNIYFSLYNNTFRGYSGCGAESQGGRGLTAMGNRFVNCGIGLKSQVIPDIHIESHNIFSNCGIGVELKGNNAYVYSNTFHHNTTVGIQKTGGALYLYDNLLYSNGPTPPNPPLEPPNQPSAALRMYSGSGIIKNNVFRNNNGTGFATSDQDIGETVIVSNNTFGGQTNEAGNTLEGMMIGVYAGALRAIDGSTTTQWITSNGDTTTPHWIYFTLDDVRVVTRVRIYTGKNEAVSWSVFVSNDPDNWGSAVATFNTVANINGQWSQSGTFSATGMYIKMQSSGGADSKIYSDFFEFQYAASVNGQPSAWYTPVWADACSFNGKNSGSFKIKNNVIRNNKRSGMSVAYTDNIMISNNTIVSNGWANYRDTETGYRYASGIQIRKSKITKGNIKNNQIRYNWFTGIDDYASPGEIGPNNTFRYNGHGGNYNCTDLKGPDGGDGAVAVRDLWDNPLDSTLIVSNNTITDNIIGTIGWKDCRGRIRYNGNPWSKCGYWDENDAYIYVSGSGEVFKNSRGPLDYSYLYSPDGTVRIDGAQISDFSTISSRKAPWGIAVVYKDRPVVIRNCKIQKNMMVNNTIGPSGTSMGGGILIGPGVQAQIYNNTITSNGFEVGKTSDQVLDGIYSTEWMTHPDDDLEPHWISFDTTGGTAPTISKVRMYSKGNTTLTWTVIVSSGTSGGNLYLDRASVVCSNWTIGNQGEKWYDSSLAGYSFSKTKRYIRLEARGGKINNQHFTEFQYWNGTSWVYPSKVFKACSEMFPGNSGIVLRCSGNTVIWSNTITSNMNAGIEARGATATIGPNNTLRRHKNFFAIGMTDNQNVTVYNNNIYSNKEGIGMLRASGNVTIYSNNVYDCGGSNFLTNNGRLIGFDGNGGDLTLNIRKNTLKNSRTAAGINLENASFDNNMTLNCNRNIIRDNKTEGIRFYYMQKANLLFSNNTIVSNTNHGIMFEENGYTGNNQVSAYIYSNLIRNNKATDGGIRFRWNLNSAYNIGRNEITNNVGGIKFEQNQGINLNITSNNIHDNTDVGIKFADNSLGGYSSAYRIANNTIQKNSFVGMKFERDNGVQDIYIFSNFITQNSNSPIDTWGGIWLFSSTNVRMEKNRIINNDGVGLRIQDSKNIYVGWDPVAYYGWDPHVYAANVLYTATYARYEWYKNLYKQYGTWNREDLTNGNANIIKDNTGWGVQILGDNYATSVTLRGDWINNNLGGQAIGVRGTLAKVKVEYCQLNSNYGEGVSVKEGGTVTLDNCRVVGGDGIEADGATNGATLNLKNGSQINILLKIKNGATSTAENYNYLGCVNDCGGTGDSPQAGNGTYNFIGSNYIGYCSINNHTIKARRYNQFFNGLRVYNGQVYLWHGNYIYDSENKHSSQIWIVGHTGFNPDDPWNTMTGPKVSNRMTYWRSDDDTQFVLAGNDQDWRVWKDRGVFYLIDNYFTGGTWITFGKGTGSSGTGGSLTVRNNVFDGFGLGFKCDDSASGGATLTGNTFKNMATGFESAATTTVSGNRFENCTVGGQTKGATTISNNVFSNNTVGFQTQASATVYSNDFHYNGVGFQSQGTTVNAYRNTFHHNRDAGAQKLGGSITFYNNTLYSNGTGDQPPNKPDAGLRMFVASATITSNSFKGQNGVGIAMADQAVSNTVIISGNTLGGANGQGNLLKGITIGTFEGGLRAIDGDTTSQWVSSTATTHWIYFTLDDVNLYTVRQVRVYAGSDVHNWDVYVSDNDTAWGTKVTTLSAGGASGWYNSAVFGKKGRYIKLETSSGTPFKISNDFYEFNYDYEYNIVTSSGPQIVIKNNEAPIWAKSSDSSSVNEGTFIVKKNTISYQHQAGIAFASANKVSIKDNTIVSNGLDESYASNGYPTAFGIAAENSVFYSVVNNEIRNNRFAGIGSYGTPGYIGPGNNIKYNGSAGGGMTDRLYCGETPGLGEGNGGVTVRGMTYGSTLIVSGNTIANNSVNSIARGDCTGTVRYNGRFWDRCAGNIFTKSDAVVYVDGSGHVYLNGVLHSSIPNIDGRVDAAYSNIYSPNASWGIIVFGGAAGVKIRNCRIYNNNLFSHNNYGPNGNNLGGGILVGFGAQAQIYSNRIYKNGYKVQPYASGGSAGIVLRCADGGTQIYSNYIYSNKSDGIDFKYSDGTIGKPGSPNYIYNNGRYGIGFTGDNNHIGTVAYNYIYNNKQQGIGVREAARPAIQYNYIYNNIGSSGIGVIELAAPYIFSNRIYNNRGIGIGFGSGVTANSGLFSSVQPLPVNEVNLANSASTADGFYNGMMLVVNSGVGSPKYTLITNYYGNTRTAVLNQNMQAVPNHSSAYTISKTGYSGACTVYKNTIYNSLGSASGQANAGGIAGRGMTGAAINIYNNIISNNGGSGNRNGAIAFDRCSGANIIVSGNYVKGAHAAGIIARNAVSANLNNIRIFNNTLANGLAFNSTVIDAAIISNFITSGVNQAALGMTYNGRINALAALDSLIVSKNTLIGKYPAASYGIALNNAPGTLRIQRNTIRNMYGSGIMAQGTSPLQGTIFGNNLSNIYNTAIQLRTGGDSLQPLTVSSNTIYNAGKGGTAGTAGGAGGIAVQIYSNLSITNNTMCSIGNGGISMQSRGAASGPIHTAWINGNVIYRCSGSGIRVYLSTNDTPSGDRVTVYNNSVYSNTVAGLRAQYACANAYIYSNNVYGNGTGIEPSLLTSGNAGIRMLASGNAYICSNKVHDNNGGGISLANFGNRRTAILRNNVITSNKFRGIGTNNFVGSIYVGTPGISTSNYIRNNKGSGIGFQSFAGTAQIYSNTISNNIGSGRPGGIGMQAGATGCTVIIRNNTVTGNSALYYGAGGIGFNNFTGAAAITINANLVSGNTGAAPAAGGIGCKGSAALTFTIKNNTIRRNIGGIGQNGIAIGNMTGSGRITIGPNNTVEDGLAFSNASNSNLTITENTKISSVAIINLANVYITSNTALTGGIACSGLNIAPYTNTYIRNNTSISGTAPGKSPYKTIATVILTNMANTVISSNQSISGSGIAISTSAKVTIRNNRLVSGAAHAEYGGGRNAVILGMDNGGGAGGYIGIRKNEISVADSAIPSVSGIALDDTSLTTVNTVTIYSNSIHGVKGAAAGSGFFGIDLAGNNTIASIKKNSIRYMGRSGMRGRNFYGNKLYIGSNTISNCGLRDDVVGSYRYADGIQLQNSHIATGYMTNNTITSNKFTGIYLYGVDGNIGPYNIIKYNGSNTVGLSGCPGLGGSGGGDGGMAVRGLGNTLVISNNTINDNYLNSLTRKDCGGTVRYNGRLWTACGQVFDQSDAVVYIAYNGIYRNGTFYSGSKIVDGRADTTFSNITGDKPWGVVVAAGTTGAVVRCCNIHNNNTTCDNYGPGGGNIGGGVLVGPGTDAWIHSNNIYENGSSSCAPGDDNGGGMGIAMRCTASNTQITKNDIYGNIGDGVAARDGGGIIGSANASNRIHDNGRHGIGIVGETAVAVQYNSIYHNLDDGITFSSTNTGQFMVKNNMIYKNSPGGIGIKRLAGTLDIYFNTLVSNRGYGVYDRTSPNISGTVNLTDNILWSNGDDINNDSYTPTVNYNDISEAGWSGNGNISRDPIFTSRGTDDYHIQAASPCKDTGTASTPPVTDDYDGGNRPDTAQYDIGADEYGSP